MDLTFTPEQRAFRDEVSTWLRENVPGEPPPHGDFAAMVTYDMAWQRRQYARSMPPASGPRVSRF